MKPNLIFPSLTLCFALMMAFTQCSSDQLPAPQVDSSCETLNATYDGAVKEIIDLTCAIAGCHFSGGGGPGDYSTYAGLEPYLNDSEFREYVIVLRDDPDNGMPPNWDTNPGPKDLTEDQFEIIKCWVDAGYPQN